MLASAANADGAARNNPRGLARFDGQAGQWRIVEGVHRSVLGRSAYYPILKAEVRPVGRLFGV